MDGGAWWATVQGVAKSWTQLSNFTFIYYELPTYFTFWNFLEFYFFFRFFSTQSWSNSCIQNPWIQTTKRMWNSLLMLALQFSSVAQSCPILCNPMDRSTSGFPIHHQLLELAQTYVLWVGDAIQPSHPLSSPPPPAFNVSQHHSLFQWVSSLHQVAKVLELQLRHQSFQQIFRTDIL